MVKSIDFTKTFTKLRCLLDTFYPNLPIPIFSTVTFRNSAQSGSKPSNIRTCSLPHPVSLTNLPNQTCAPFWNHSFGFLVSVFSHLCKFRWTLVHSVLWEKFLQCFMFQYLYRLYNECYIHSKHICFLTFFFCFFSIFTKFCHKIWKVGYMVSISSVGTIDCYFCLCFLFILKKLFFLFSTHKTWTLDRVSISSKGLFTAIFACFFLLILRKQSLFLRKHSFLSFLCS